METKRILIVEDNPIKLESILSSISSFNIKTDVVITPADAISQLKQISYDFFILDMSLPSYEEEKNSIGSLSGKQILQTMKHKRISVPTVIITQWDVFGHHDDTVPLDNLKEELLEKFSKNLLDIIFWEKSDESWKEDLKSYLKRAFND
ncbi:response regulator receiver protein [Aliivibrio fischeri MJ11]|uniref:Response regulator receiver protein n=1 Tax=Aliivibrio fischeri (strain MJ11) TaxID=388396 RepID=B5FDK7_ALIFM|nr:response regulator [Aliivibrio fischeri]ACH66909.1 response regulator receiver protein [Aliivibrio fischeri MJ11]